jgi:hypothetical protein
MMGFTRYWEFEKLDSEKFKDFSSICQLLIDDVDIPLDDVTVNETQVRFNGVDDDGHETFNFSLNKDGFNFCKTATKPYDEVVCGCLYIAKLIFGDSIKINQDSDSSDDNDVLVKVKGILRENKLNQFLK